MKVVLSFEIGDGMESSQKIIGFETDSIANLEASIREVAGRYLKDLTRIENKISKLFNLKRITNNEINRREDEIRRNPYLIRSGSYVLWAGEFVMYQFDGDDLVRKYVEPKIYTLDEWFDSVTEKDLLIH